MHITSLPGPHGNGDLGSEARRFVDWLQQAEQSYWQMLPVAPCGHGNSPYSAQSAFAGNPLLIALEPLVERGWLAASDLADTRAFAGERVDYAASERFRSRCLRRAFERARHTLDLQTFREQHRSWLDDYALFRAFAFGTDNSANDFLPHNYPRRTVVYTGTHDNDTIVGWFEAREELADQASTRSPEQIAKEQRAVLRYLGAADGGSIHWDMIRLCLMSVADTAIFPLQDILGLGSEARMNRPGRAAGNWEWRSSADAISSEAAERLADLTRCYER